MGICAGRTVIITGAGGGLGRAYALAFAAEGANVVVNDIRREAAEAVVDEICSNGGQAIASDGDITTLSSAQGIVDAALAAFGEVHVLVNNAGVLRDRMFISLSEEDWDMVMRVHLKGHYCLANILGRRWRDLAKAGTPVAGPIFHTSTGAGLKITMKLNLKHYGRKQILLRIIKLKGLSFCLFLTGALLLLLLAETGCRSQKKLIHIMKRINGLPKNIRTVAVPAFQFEARGLRYRVESRFTEAVSREIIKRGNGLKVQASRTGADAVLEGTIRDFSFSGVLLDSEGRARVYEVTIVTAVTIRDLKENKILDDNQNFTFRDSFEFTYDTR